MAVGCLSFLDRGALSTCVSPICAFSQRKVSDGCIFFKVQYSSFPQGGPEYGGFRRVRWQVCSARKGALTDYDLYELLGLEKSASKDEVRSAYRWLQKRCHPDVVGEEGHDMAILLNDAYAVLSDPKQRAIYDDMRKDAAQFEGFTGQPLYSVWSGAAEKQEAVFVDESRCVGCLKCALIAPNTFAIENQHGRARAVRQCGDSEDTIEDACRSCPVSCILMVNKSQLPVLEFVMSKQPRVALAVEGQSNGGVRHENVFTAAEKFAQKWEQREKQQSSKESAAQRAARKNATAGIRARGGRWWHHWIGNNYSSEMSTSSNWNAGKAHSAKGALVHMSWPGNSKARMFSSREFQPQSLGALYKAAAQRRRGESTMPNGADGKEEDEYWTPHEPISCPIPVATDTAFGKEDTKNRKWIFSEESMRRGNLKGNWLFDLDSENKVDTKLKNFLSGIPVGVSSIAAVLVGMASDTGPALSETDIVGPLSSAITTSLAMQMFLAAAVWYVMSLGVCVGILFGSLLVIRLREKNSL